MKSRKLWFFAVSGSMFTALQVTGNLPTDAVVYSNLMTIVLLGYAGGNVGEHIAKR